MNSNVQIAIDFLKAVSSRKSPEELRVFYHTDIEHIEYPNAITKNTTFRNMDALLEGAEKGSKVLVKEEYEIIKSYGFEDSVIIEAIWTGTLAIPLGKLQPGDKMKAYFAQFFEIKDGKIFRQRNYDCFEPFS